MICRALLLALLAALAACAAAKLHGPEHDGSGPLARRGRSLLAIKESGGGAAALLRTDQPQAAAARLCALQCAQHHCIGWHKAYMGSGDEEGSQPAAAVPAAAAECLARCPGLSGGEASCLAQTFQRLLNTQPLQYSCSSSCVTGLLHSACSQCAGGCAALEMDGSLAAAECLVDAAP